MQPQANDNTYDATSQALAGENVNLLDFAENINDLIRKSQADRDPEAEQLFQSDMATGIDKQLEDLEANDEQKALFKNSLIMYMQGRIDNHLQELFPDEFFEELDDMIDNNEIQPEEVVPVVLAAYEAVMEQPITVYSSNLLNEILPEFKQMFKEGQDNLKKILALAPDKQSQFIRLVEQRNYDEAKAFLAEQ